MLRPAPLHFVLESRVLISRVFFSCLVLCGLFALPLAAQPAIDGTLSDGDYTLLDDNSGGPASGFGVGHEVNALYAYTDGAGDLTIGVAGNVQNGNRILVFFDTRAGGFNDGSFGRGNAPQGIDDWNAATTFDAGFDADYCLVIGTNGGGDYFWDLFDLAGDTNNFLGDQNDADLAASPANSDLTQGFESRLSFNTTGVGVDLQVDDGMIQLFAAYISDGGFLSNQFITPAGGADGNYGSGAITFGAASPDPVDFSGLPVELQSFSVD